MKIKKYIAALTLALAVGSQAYADDYSSEVVWSFNDQGVMRNSTLTMPIFVDNTVDLSGWQCDITVPDGVTITEVTLNPERVADHIGDLCLYADNKYRYVAASMTFSGTKGTNGPLMYVKMSVNISKPELEEGQEATEEKYDVKLSNLRSTDTERPNTTEYVSAPFTGQLEVLDYPVEPFALTDGVAYTNNIDYTGVDVTYTRNFKNTSWQPLYIPFDMSYDEWSADASVAELAGVHMYDDGSPTIIEFITVGEGSSLIPNTPYVIRAKSVKEVTFTSTNKELKAAPIHEGSISCSSPRYTYTLNGIYQTKNQFSENDYIMGGGVFGKPKSGGSIGSYRFYMVKSQTENGYWQVSRAEEDDEEIIYIMVDGELCGIAEINKDLSTDSEIYYDILGRPVENPSRGIFIQNGKKILKK